MLLWFASADGPPIHADLVGCYRILIFVQSYFLEPSTNSRRKENDVIPFLAVVLRILSQAAHNMLMPSEFPRQTSYTSQLISTLPQLSTANLTIRIR